MKLYVGIAFLLCCIAVVLGTDDVTPAVLRPRGRPDRRRPTPPPQGDQEEVEGEHRGRWPRTHNHGHHAWTDEERATHMCSRVQDDGQSNSWRQAKLRRLTPEQRQETEQQWQRKKADVIQCCARPVDERVACMKSVKMARYERVCRNEETLRCPFSQEDNDDTKTAETVARCCAMQGDDRYQCFTDSHGSHGHQRGRHGRFNGRRPPAASIAPARVVISQQ